MGRIEVDPSQLSAAGTGHQALAGDLFSLGGQVDSLAGSATGAIADAHAGGTLADCGLAWSRSLNGLADAVARLGVNLEAASRAYAQVDASVMPRR
jgi:Excreted virulence factor EspC, type VII ESX diderm